MIQIKKAGETKVREGDVFDALLDCHARIRTFLGLARRLAGDDPATETETRDAAAAVERYFTVALPLHVLDEDESLLPRLRGRNADLDLAIALMHGEHLDHKGTIARLASLCGRVRAE